MKLIVHKICRTKITKIWRERERCRKEGERSKLVIMAVEIPVVDLSLGEEEVVRTLRRACSTAGFFFLAGHGLDPELVREVFCGARDFFARDQKTKDGFKAKQGEHPFGYQSAIEENIRLDSAGQEHPDQREQLKVGRGNYLTDYNNFMEFGCHRPTRGPRPDDRSVVWLSDATSEPWRRRVDEYFEGVSSLGHRLLRLLAISLGLEEDFFDASFTRPLELMNLNYYHAQKAKLGCGSHTDYGMVTILRTDGVPGLQVCSDKTRPEGLREWIDVDAAEGHFVVNCGDMLERWTNGRYVSNLHRVFNKTGGERVSVAFFFEPNVNATVKPTVSVAEGRDGRAYDPVVYGEWLQQKYVDTGEVI